MLPELSVAGMVCPNNVFLAPMAGYTNLPFRTLCEQLGAGLTFTEMVSAKGLHYKNEETRLLLLHTLSCPPPASGGGVGVRVRPSNSSNPSPRAAQLFGSDPDVMREACESEELAPFDLIDINMGCPMPKIVKNGEGSALMEDPALAEKIVSSCVKSGKRISVKFRTGIKEGDRMAAEFAKRCEGAGACMVTVHGRVRERIYAGPVDYEQIAAAKAAVKIPVIANGGIWNRKDMEQMLSRTGADGVMVARAALYRPTVFSELTGKEEPPLSELFLWQLGETERLYGERFATVFMRKMAAFYIKGRRGANAIKTQLFSVTSTDGLRALAEKIFG